MKDKKLRALLGTIVAAVAAYFGYQIAMEESNEAPDPAPVVSDPL